MTTQVRTLIHKFEAFKKFVSDFIPLPIFYLFFVKGCTCKDLVNVHGFGNCRDRKNVHQGNKAICYVNLPSDCNDLVDSIMIPGEKSSAEACQSQGRYCVEIVSTKNILYLILTFDA